MSEECSNSYIKSRSIKSEIITRLTDGHRPESIPEIASGKARHWYNKSKYHQIMMSTTECAFCHQKFSKSTEVNGFPKDISKRMSKCIDTDRDGKFRGIVHKRCNSYISCIENSLTPGSLNIRTLNKFAWVRKLAAEYL